MQHVISSSNYQSLHENLYKLNQEEKRSLISRFIRWCEFQEDQRFLWLGIALMGNIGMVLPLTILSVLFAGNNFILWMTACIVNVPVLAVNLAAQPTKVTLPVLFFAWLVNLIIILSSLSVLLFA